jgi:hypothetical protein
MAGAIVGKQDILFWATANSMDPGGYVARTGHFPQQSQVVPISARHSSAFTARQTRLCK